MINKIEMEIQKDLDAGKFGWICSNETNFNTYVFEKLQKAKEQAAREAVATFPNPSYSQAEADRQIEQAIKEYKDNLKQKIGQLRQWLNEDRITRGDKFVTFVQLESWLMD